MPDLRFAASGMTWCVAPMRLFRGSAIPDTNCTARERAMIGLVTGFQPFAGLPTNPAEMLLRPIDGTTVEGIDIVVHSTPVSYRAVPDLLAELIAKHHPAFMMGIGLAPGAPVMRVEKV